MKSMTGFGVGEAPLGQGKVVAEIRAVNHRYLDVRVKLPKDLADSTMLVEQIARGRLTRGRCEIVVRTEGSALPEPRIDRVRARAAFHELAAIRDELAPGAELPLSLLATIPELFASTVEAELPRVRDALERAVAASLDDMDAMRQREGDAIERDLRARLAAIRGIVEAIEARLPEVVATYRKRIAERVSALLAAAEAHVDEARLEQEVVLFADRTDVSEELTRLRIHLDGVTELLGAREPSGRRLDFLLQEMGREINTLGSKSQDASVARAVIDAKSELERMREQVQNVE